MLTQGAHDVVAPKIGRYPDNTAVETWKFRVKASYGLGTSIGSNDMVKTATSIC
jgi:hypothetical protein